MGPGWAQGLEPKMADAFVHHHLCSTVVTLYKHVITRQPLNRISTHPPSKIAVIFSWWMPRRQRRSCCPRFEGSQELQLVPPAATVIHCEFRYLDPPALARELVDVDDWVEARWFGKQRRHRFAVGTSGRNS